MIQYKNSHDIPQNGYFLINLPQDLTVYEGEVSKCSVLLVNQNSSCVYVNKNQLKLIIGSNEGLKSGSNVQLSITNILTQRSVSIKSSQPIIIITSYTQDGVIIDETDPEDPNNQLPIMS